MAQHDYTIANQGFPATRSDINNVLSAISTNNSGTSAPTTQYAGQFWIDTTSSTWTMYIHDGADDIQFATIDTSANTVNFIDSELGADSVNGDKIADDSIDSEHYVDGSIDTAHLSDGAVTSAKINYPLTTFSSTGIDDNATANALTIDSSSNLQFNSGYGSVATAYGCRAWVNFNGTGTVAINSSGNISSITDTGTGSYEVNFTNSLPDANYGVGTCSRQTTGGGTVIARLSNILTASLVKLFCVDNSDNAVDPVTVAVIITR